MKYIIFEDEKTGLLHPVIFADHTTHSSIKINGAKAISAGFVDLTDKVNPCYGESNSLNLKPRKEDYILIHRLLLNFGIYGFMHPLI